ncbi:hypothetical protein E0K89_008100 [Aquicoccus sp. SCR17]|nr:hypothetical protein [Carideicomes alvinocaridis]
MSPKTLALILFSEDEARWLLPAAVELANRYRAHLVGLCPGREIMPRSGAYAEWDGTVITMLTDQEAKEREAIAKRFADATRAQDFASEFRTVERAGYGAETFLLGNLRAADMVLAGRCDDQTSPRQKRLLEQVIRQAGRPVLVLPQSWTPGALGTHVLVGWSDTREATRAAHDALAMAGPKAKIDILHAGPAGEEPATAYRQDMAAAFDRLGHDVTLLERDAPAGEAGTTLIAVARERGADMIAVGAFGHSRAYDFVIGAVSHYLLESATLPVLFSK